jgi:hypothetical protein
VLLKTRAAVRAFVVPARPHRRLSSLDSSDRTFFQGCMNASILQWPGRLCQQQLGRSCGLQPPQLLQSQPVVIPRATAACRAQPWPCSSKLQQYRCSVAVCASSNKRDLLLGLASLPLLPWPAAAAALEQQSVDIAQLQVCKVHNTTLGLLLLV